MSNSWMVTPNVKAIFYNYIIMKTLELNQMEFTNAGCSLCWGVSESDLGCAALGLAAGIASGLNPLVGGLTTLGCMLTT